MADPFRLPSLGEGMAEAVVVKWLVGLGEKVEVDQPVVEISTDWRTLDIPSSRSGYVVYRGFKEGETVSVGSVLWVVGESGEKWNPLTDSEEAEKRTEVLAVSELGLRAVTPPPIFSRRAQTSPEVRRLAREQESPERGEDVSGAVEENGVEIRRLLSRPRRDSAEAIAQAWREIPHAYAFDEVDASRFLSSKDAIEGRVGHQIPHEALLIKLVLPILDAVPEFTAKLENDVLVFPERVDIGVSVETIDGPTVGIVRSPRELTVTDIGIAVSRLADRARSNTLPEHDTTGQCFTVADLGVVGGGGFGVIPLDTAAILCVGRVPDRPVVNQGRLTVGPVLSVALSYDPRLIDLRQVRKFMEAIAANLADPTPLIGG